MFEQLPDPAPEWSDPWWLSFLGLCLVCWIAAWVWIPEDKAVPGGARRCQGQSASVAAHHAAASHLTASHLTAS